MARAVLLDLGIKRHVAVVSGVERGIGTATARLLADEWRVVVWDRDNEPVANETAEPSGEAFAVAGSVANLPDLEALTRAAITRFGTSPILVDNAGVAYIGTAVHRRRAIN